MLLLACLGRIVGLRHLLLNGWDIGESEAEALAACLVELELFVLALLVQLLDR